jgi:hypothetical protein
MLEIPFFKELAGAKSILLAGAGGGFDILCGLPLYFALKKQGLTVHLANLSFSFRHGDITGNWLGPDLVEVTASSSGNEYYFPEGYLSKWFCRKREDESIYCIRPSGSRAVLESYRTLLKHLGFDTIILVDGGVDAILKGDELRIGTPVEDMASLSAVSALELERKFLVCLGFSAETDVSHAHALETIAGYIAADAFLGALALTAEMPEVKRFVEAVEFVFYDMRGYESVICSSVLSALEGKYGDFHRTRRTLGSQLWINPLMQLYWFFRLDGVAAGIPYLKEIMDSKTLDDVRAVIINFRDEVPRRQGTPDLPSRLQQEDC